jgi:hypothetical protein
MKDSGKHSNIFRYGKKYCRKMFYSTGPWSGKNLLGKNTLEFDYFPAASATKTNRLKALKHVINALKLFVTSA